MFLELSGKLDLELRSVRDTYQKLKTEYESATEKLKFFEKVMEEIFFPFV